MQVFPQQLLIIWIPISKVSCWDMKLMGTSNFLSVGGLINMMSSLRPAQTCCRVSYLTHPFNLYLMPPCLQNSVLVFCICKGKLLWVCEGHLTLSGTDILTMRVIASLWGSAVGRVYHDLSYTQICTCYPMDDQNSTPSCIKEVSKSCIIKTILTKPMLNKGLLCMPFTTVNLI
jgi:hypothetical protein